MPIPEVELPAGAGHGVGTAVFLLPEAPLGVVNEEPLFERVSFLAAVPRQIEIVAAIQRTAHRRLHVGEPGRVQFFGYLGGDAPVPGHHTVRREIVERLVQHTEAAGRVPGHPTAAQGTELEIRRLGAVELVQSVLLEEQHRPQAGGRAGKRPVAAHRDRIAVLRDAAVGEPVGGVAQLAAVDDVLGLCAAPQPIVALGQIVQVRHPAFQPEGIGVPFHRRAFAVDAGPAEHLPALGQGPVKIIAARLGLHLHPVVAARRDDAVSFQLLPVQVIAVLHAAHRHGIPDGKILPDAARLDPAPLQLDGRPVARSLVVDFQHALAAVRLLDVVHLEEQLPVRRILRLLCALAGNGIGLAGRIAGGQHHIGTAAVPHGTELRHRTVPRVKGDLVREDDDLRTHAHHLLFAVRHRVPEKLGLLRGLIRVVDEVLPRRHQQTVQVVDAVHLHDAP